MAASLSELNPIELRRLLQLQIACQLIQQFKLLVKTLDPELAPVIKPLKKVVRRAEALTKSIQQGVLDTAGRTGHLTGCPDPRNKDVLVTLGLAPDGADRALLQQVRAQLEKDPAQALGVAPGLVEEGNKIIASRTDHVLHWAKIGLGAGLLVIAGSAGLAVVVVDLVTAGGLLTLSTACAFGPGLVGGVGGLAAGTGGAVGGALAVKGVRGCKAANRMSVQHQQDLQSLGIIVVNVCAALSRAASPNGGEMVLLVGSSVPSSCQVWEEEEEEEEEDEEDCKVAVLQLPMLQSGVTHTSLGELAYLLAAASLATTSSTTSGHSHRKGLQASPAIKRPHHKLSVRAVVGSLLAAGLDSDLLAVLARQLGLEEGRASDVVSVLRHMDGGDWSASRRCSAEGLLAAVAQARHTDFTQGFAPWVRWRQALCHVLEVAGGLRHKALQGSAESSKLMARLCGVLRLMDVRSLERYDEDQYARAAEEVTRVFHELALCGLEGTRVGADTQHDGLKLPWSIRASLAEVLLTALIDEGAAVQSMLQDQVWCALGVSHTVVLALSTCVRFRQYVATGHSSHATQLKELVFLLRDQVPPASAPPPPPGSTSEARSGVPYPLTGRDEDEADVQLAAQVLESVFRGLVDRLSSYHHRYPPRKKQAGKDALQVLLTTAVSVGAALGRSEVQLTSLLVEVVEGSVLTHWRRLCSKWTGSRCTPAYLQRMAIECAEEVVATETTWFRAVMEPYLPHHLVMVRATLHKAVGEVVLPWINQGPGPDPWSLEALRMAIRLDAQLGGAVDEHCLKLARQRQQQQPAGGNMTMTAPPPLGPSVVRWELHDTIKAVLDKFVDDGVSTLNQWVGRQLDQDKWDAEGSIEMVVGAVRALFAMGLPVDKREAHRLVEGAAKAMTRFTHHVRSRLGDPQRLIPPTPTLTRYKRKPVDKQAEGERKASQQSPETQHQAQDRGFLDKIKDWVDSPPRPCLRSVPQVTDSPDHGVISSLTPKIISHYITALHGMGGVVPAVVACLDDIYNNNTAGAQSAWSPAPLGGYQHWVAELFHRVLIRDLEDTCRLACTFLANKVVSWDHRDDWYERLYRHSVPLRSSALSCRIDPLLDTFSHQELAVACAGLPGELGARVATELLTAAAKAWQRVVLDGGPCRWFSPDDVTALRSDLDLMQDEFRELLGSGPTIAAMQPCRRLLLLVSCDVDQLTTMLQEARTNGQATMQTAEGRVEAFNEATIKHVLAHRPDRPASKVLMTHYKTPTVPRPL